MDNITGDSTLLGYVAPLPRKDEQLIEIVGLPKIRLLEEQPVLLFEVAQPVPHEDKVPGGQAEVVDVVNSVYSLRRRVALQDCLQHAFAFRLQGKKMRKPLAALLHGPWASRVWAANACQAVWLATCSSLLGPQ